MTPSAPSGPSTTPWAVSADDRLARTVATRLAARRSDFRHPDVVTALASAHPGGASVTEALQWADRFCTDAEPVRSPTRRPRWTTSLARRADEELTRRLDRLPPARALLGLDVSGAMQQLPTLSTEQRHTVEQILGQGHGVVRLAAAAGDSGLLDRAEIVAACRAVCAGAGVGVDIATVGTGPAARWEVLAGPTGPSHPDRVGLLVVDRADRRPTAELLSLTARAEAAGAGLLLIEGGTLPRLTAPASRGLFASTSAADLACPTAPSWTPGDTGPAADLLPGRRAAARTLDLWGSSPGSVMVGLGIDEVRGLNHAACRLVRAAQPPSAGPGADALLPPGRAPGDRVVLLHGGRGLPPYGSAGTVVEHDRRAATFEVAWDRLAGQHQRPGGGPAPETNRFPITTRSVGPGWAVSAGMAAKTGNVDGPMVVLGRARSVPLRLDGDVLWAGRQPSAPDPTRRRSI